MQYIIIRLLYTYFQKRFTQILYMYMQDLPVHTRARARICNDFN